MRRLVVVACTVALLAVACGEQQLGRKVVECGLPTESVTTTLILTAQAVPSADFVPCVEALRPGWGFDHVRARNGQAFFTIDSDRVGEEFLRVTLLPACDVGSASEEATDEPGTTLAVEVLEERGEYPVVVIPVAERHDTYAVSLAVLYTGDIVRGRRVVVAIDNSDRPISEKIELAHKAGRPVLIVDDAEVDTGTVSLRLAGEEEKAGLGFEAALEEIEEEVESPLYRARWFYTFPGGCIRYDIDAEGEGAQSVARDVARAIGVYPMADLHRLARDAGYTIFDE